MAKWATAAIFTSLVLSGCVAIGPANTVDFDRAVVRSTPAAEGKVMMSGEGYWLPNIKGFAGTQLAFYSGSVNQVTGALILTDRSLLIGQWEDKSGQFSIIKRIAFSEMREAALDEKGINRLIVVRTLDYQYDSFSFSQAQGTFVDKDKTIAAQRYISGLVPIPRQ